MSDDTDDVHPLVERGELLVVPGVYDALSATLADRAGFETAVLTGYGFAASHLGEPDVGLFTQSEILDCARRISAATDLGLVVDGDAGGGGPLNVRRLVAELSRIDATGVILEDQRWPKRCGHMAGKSVVDAAEHARKIRAAVDAREGTTPFVTARTDALETHGMEEALRRARLYEEAGADLLFVEGPRTRSELETVATELPGPLTVNLVEGGRTPMPSLADLNELGFFSAGFVLSGLYAAAHALDRTYRTIRAEGSTDELRDELLAFEAFNEVVGQPERLATDERYAEWTPGRE